MIKNEDREIVSFWCDKCHEDFDTPSRVKKTYYEDGYFISHCPKNHEVVRYITGKEDDPYFFKSEKMKRQRYEFRKDIIQPGQDGFETLYKKEYDKIEKAREAYEKKMMQRKREAEAYYKKLKEQQVDSKIINRAMEAERGHYA